VKTQVWASEWAVMAFRCCVLLGDIVLEASNYVCIMVVV
jgi:hypothetical protein